jgi:glucan endo-1,6-beta-glucosidase
MVGEWSLATGFSESNDFMSKWADAQKLIYSQGKGWIFWNFKIEEGGDRRHWDYGYGVEMGWFTKDAEDFNDKNVCDGYQKRMGRVVRRK